MTQAANNSASINRSRLAWIGAGIFILLLLVVVVLFFVLRRSADPPVSTIYLVDASRRMAEPLSDGEVTRLGAAKGFVTDVVSRSTSESVMGLRAFGSGAVADPCEDTELIVPPAPGVQSAIVTGVDDLQTISEEAALIPGAIAAIRDLAQLDNRGLMRLVIVTGGDGTCLNQSVDLLVREANREDINLETIIISIGPAGRDVVALRSLVEELDGAILVEASDAEALGEIGELIEEGGFQEVATLVASNPTATLSTSTPVPTPTETPLPPPPTIEPTDTATPAPAATNTTSPPTNTPAPPTNTPSANPSPTSGPTATPTQSGPSTATNTPRPTNTPAPTSTPTQLPPPTATNTSQPPPPPPPTATPQPTSTPPPTATPPPTSTPPPTPTPSVTPTPGPPTTLSIQDATVTEGPGASVLISVIRSSPSDGRPVTVDFSVLPNTAFAGSDYTPLSGQLSWGAFEVGPKTFEILIINNDIEEPDETFTAFISNPINATIARGSATVTIFDDDQPTINHTQQHFYITESSGSVDIEFSLGSQPADDVTIPLVNFSQTVCTIPVTQMVITPSNFTGVSIPVTILDDAAVDGDPSNLCYIQTGLSTSNDPEYDSVNPADFNINIFDDDALYVTTQCTEMDGQPGCDEEALVYRTVQSAVDESTPVNNIYIENGTYTEAGIIVSRNINFLGDGTAASIVQGAPAPGGAPNRVFQIQPGLTVTMGNITVRNGNAAGNGGAILNNASLTLNNVAVRGGQATGTGGGIFNPPGSVLTVQSSTIDGNLAAAGGGIDNSGSLFVNQSTISRNQGGGIQSVNGFDLRNSTVSSNTGPGVNMISGKVVLKNSTIAFNTGVGVGGTADSQNSILDQNNPNCNGPVTSLGYTLFGSVGGCAVTPGTGDQTNVSANLGGLGNNGGPTETHLPQGGSPAINNGNPNPPSTDGTGGVCLTVDQRGTSRPVNGQCDIGSVEQ